MENLSTEESIRAIALKAAVSALKGRMKDSSAWGTIDVIQWAEKFEQYIKNGR